MPTWIQPLAEQLWSFIAVAIAVNALGSVSKNIADRFGWRKYRQRDAARLIAQARVAQDTGTKPIVPALVPEAASWYDMTLRVHPLIAGAAFGFLSLPSLNVIDALAKDPEVGPNAVLAARCAWFMLAGALSGQVYEAVKFAFVELRARAFGLVGGPMSKPSAHDEDDDADGPPTTPLPRLTRDTTKEDA